MYRGSVCRLAETDENQPGGQYINQYLNEEALIMNKEIPGVRSVRSTLIWTVGGAVFGMFFGAIAAVFQGGPGVVQGIQETWWWFAVAGFLAATVGSKS